MMENPLNDPKRYDEKEAPVSTFMKLPTLSQA